MHMRLLARIIAFAAVFAAPCALAQTEHAPDFNGRSLAAAGIAIPEGRLTDRVTVAPDGVAIRWYMDRRGVQNRQGIVLLLQGSGCVSVTRNFNMAVAAAILRPNDAIVVIDKAGVGRGDNPENPMEQCSEEFWRTHTVSRRAADASRVLDEIEREGWWNGRLTLFGGSEGGPVVAILAAQRPEADAAIVLSAGLGRPFATTLLEALPPEVRAIAPHQFDEIRRNPDPSKRWGGNTHMWYADILDRDFTADLLRSRAKILIVQGERDQPASARAVRDRFEAAQRCNLTYREYAGLEHQMRDEAGESRFVSVLQDIEAWLDRNDAQWRTCARA